MEIRLPSKGWFDTKKYCEEGADLVKTVRCEKRCFLDHYKV